MPTLSQVHIDTALTNLSLMYRNETYIADLALPVLPVVKRSDKYFTYNRADFTSASPTDSSGRPVSLRRPGSEAAELDYSLSTDSYYCEEYAYRGFVPDAEIAYADNPLQPDMDQTLQLTERLLLDNETTVAAKLMTRANFPSANRTVLTTGATGTSWKSYTSANSNPFLNILDAVNAIIAGVGREPTDMLVGINTARVLADHPAIKELTKYTNADGLTKAGLPKVIRGLTVLEGAQQKNAAAEGLAYSGGGIWKADDGTDAALIYYKTGSPSLRTVAFGYTLEAPDDTTGARGLAIRQWREEKRKGKLIEASFMREWKFIAVDGSGLSTGGYLISSATI